MLFESNGTLLKCNPACLRLHGLTEGEALLFCKNPGENFAIYDLYHQELPIEQWPYSRVLNGEEFSKVKLKVVRKDTGKTFFGSFSGKPEYDANGKFMVGVIFINDITEEIAARQELYSELIKHQDNDHELARYQQQLKEDRQLLQTIIDTIPVMVVIYDEKVQKVTLNKAVEDITGYSNDDLLHHDILELAYPDPLYRKEVFRYMRSLQPGFKDLVMRTKDGRDIETSWANVRIPDGRQVGVGIDISERKKIEEAMRDAMRRSETESKVQYAFIQNISHEVRTPMNSILGFTELLQKTVIGSTETEYLDAIDFNGKQLMRLIDDIVDFSRLDKNEMSLSKEYVSVGKFIARSRMLMPGLKRKYKRNHLNLVLKEPFDRSREIILHTDIHRLQQVLTNLITNALKFTEKGGVEFGYRLLEKEGKVLFYVKDSGMGISPEDHERVFKRFNRLHDTRKSEFRGTGLGLAICKHLVSLLDGEIWFESEPGKGSVFYFTHPFYRIEEVPADQPVYNEENGEIVPLLDDKTILIVEDDPFSFLMLQGMLLDTRANILHADTGPKAVEYFDKNEVDLVLLDIRLPEMDGYQVIEKIREINADVPVVAQTANALHVDREKSKMAGFEDHVSKPISMEVLYAMLNTYLVQ